MALWSDIVEPSVLTGYVRESLDEIERKNGSLARFLPSFETFGTSVTFERYENGLVPEASYRAYDAEIEVSKGSGEEQVEIKLPPVGTKQVISEYHQLRLMRKNESALEKAILRAARRVALSVEATVERMRGKVLVEGKAVIDQPNFKSTDDFMRDSRLTVTASQVWSGADAKILEDIESWVDTYTAVNGLPPARMLVGQKVSRLLRRHKDFATALANGGTRPATMDDLRGVFDSSDLPYLEVYTRRTSAGLILPENQVLFLPEPVVPDLEEESPLGNTFWGQTLSSTLSQYAIEESEQPGIVAGAYRGDAPPHIAEVVGDAIALPVLANPNLTMAVKVLS